MGYLELITIFVISLACIMYGAKRLVDGSVLLARKSGISEFVIGLVIVGIGTSSPEMVVSYSAALNGNADISLGNVIGSNIFNTLLILGITPFFYPIIIKRENRRDILLNFLATCLVLFFILTPNLVNLLHGEMDFNMNITRIEGVIFLIAFALYIFKSFRMQESEVLNENTLNEIGGELPKSSASNEIEVIDKGASGFKIGFMIIFGLALLITGGHFFVESAVILADKIGLSHKFIAITLIAGGTSLPELATCIAAGIRKEDQMALGNILGSNVFNLLLILGGAATIKELNASSISPADFGILFLSTLPLIVFSLKKGKQKIGKTGGVVMLLMFAAYMTYLFITL